MTAEFTKVFFEGYINSVFTVCLDDSRRLDLRLVEIHGRVQPAIETFTLIFAGPLDPIAESATLRVEHAQIDPFELFLGPFFTPLKNDAIYYQATFTKIKTKSGE